MTNILVTEPEYFDEDAIKILKEIGNVYTKRLSYKELEEKIPDMEVLVIRAETLVDRNILDKARKLKMIASATTGLNHIDIDYAKSKGIKIINLSGTHTVSTAEHTFALMLSFCKRIPWAHEHMKLGKWKRYKFFGNLLSSKTLGIIGLGKIGSKVAEYAKTFGMNIVAYDPYVNSAEIRLVPLEELLRNSDIVTIHAMLTKETENLIGDRQLKIMKRDAVIINTARSRIIDVDALLKALEEKNIGGAALDVFHNEPITKEEEKIIDYARKNRNLLLTPHIAASAKEVIHEAGIEIAMRIKEELKFLA